MAGQATAWPSGPEISLRAAAGAGLMAWNPPGGQLSSWRIWPSGSPWVGSARSAEVQGICDAALGYLDGKIGDSYRISRKRILNLDNLGYLGCISLYPLIFLHKRWRGRQAVDYFLGQARKHWRQWDFYSGAHRPVPAPEGRQEIPPRILASLREHSP